MKQRLHEMMCSQEEPTGEFLDKLIPTGSASMKNAIEKIRKPLMQMLQVRIEKFPVVYTRIVGNIAVWTNTKVGNK